MVDTIGGRRREDIEYDGESLVLRELNARDLLLIWADLEKAEQTGNVLDAYLKVIQAGTFSADGSPRFTDSPDEISTLPARVVMGLARRILDMSEVGLEAPPPEDPMGAPAT